MKKEFALAFNEVLEDKQLPREVIIEAIEAAMVSAYRKAVNASNAQQIIAEINPDDGKVRIFAEKEVVDDVQDDRTEVLLAKARKVNPEAELGGMVIVESTPKNFGRVAAQTARQVIQQRMREAERNMQHDYFAKQIGDVLNGVVQAQSKTHLTLGLDKKAEGVMPSKEQIPGERVRLHDRIRALLLDVKQTPRGPQIILSRSHRNFLRRLLEDEVPEIYHGMVEIRSIAREPGQRSKVSVSALQPGIDPVGACVGVRGVRIQAIVRELHDEKIDVIEWSANTSEYIAKALSPARVVGVYLEKQNKSNTKTATVVVPEDQLSLAIGRDGQNARLAAKLTGWRIDIKSLPEAASDLRYKLDHDEEYMKLVEQEADFIPQVDAILGKKAEGRPVTPEEYNLMTRFVQRVENNVAEMRAEEKVAAKAYRDTIRASIPDAAFDIPVEDLGMSPRVNIALGGAGYSTVGELLYQMEIDSDAILAVNDIGPKMMKVIEEALASFEIPVADEVEEIAEEVAPVSEPVSEEIEPEIEVEEPEAVEAEMETVVEEVVPAAEPVVEEAEIEEPVVADVVVSEEAEEKEAIAGVGKDEEVVEDLSEGEKAKIKAEKPKKGKPVVVKEPLSFEELLEMEGKEFELDEDDELDTDKKKKRRKKRFVELEYDPDRDVTVVKRKRKRGSQTQWSDWDDEW